MPVLPISDFHPRILLWSSNVLVKCFQIFAKGDDVMRGKAKSETAAYRSRGLGRAIVIVAACTTLLFLGLVGAEAQSPAQKLAPELETELALSAAPPHLRKQASVYLYDPAVGMVQSRAGENGYTCFVARTDIVALPMHIEYRDDLIIPMCFDRVGSKYIVPEWFYAEAQRAKGVSAADLLARLMTKVTAPPNPGVSPMISPILRIYFTPTCKVSNLNLPHYMYYAPNAGVEDLGGIYFSPTHPFIANQDVFDGKQAFMIHVLGPVAKAAINAEYKDMLQKLCDARVDRAYCMDIDTAGLRDQLTWALQSLPEKLGDTDSS